MQFVLSSPSVIGSRASASLCESRRQARQVGCSQILKTSYKLCLPPNTNWKQLKAFCFLFYCLFSQRHMSHHICILKILLWLQCGAWSACRDGVPVTAERLLGDCCNI